MSLEDTIALAANEVGQARDEILDFVNVAQTQISRVADQYVANLASQNISLYVDPIAGDDAASGEANAPLKSLQQAVDLVPRGGRGTILLFNQLSISGASVDIDNKNISLASATGARLAVTGEGYVEAGTGFRKCHGFSLDFGGRLALSGLSINLPVAAGAVASAAYHGQSGFIHSKGTIADAGSTVVVAFCDMNFPASPVGKLTDFTLAPQVLHMEANTVTGTMFGNLVSGASSSDGTPASAVAGLSTNLATV